MDVVRGTAVLLIVVWHGSVLMEEYADLLTPVWLAQANTVLTPLRIPLLVLLSGMLLGGSLGKGRGRYFSGKARHIAWPYLVWAVVWGAMSWPVYSVVGFALGGSYLWFLLYLLSFYCVAWFLRRVPPEVVVLVALAGAALALALGGSVTAERWTFLFAVFMAGHVVTVRPAARRWLFGSAAAPVVAVLLLGAHLAVQAGYDYGLESALLFVSGGILLIRLARLSGSAPVLAPLRRVGRHSIVYYVSHFPVMAVTAVAATAAGVSRPGLLLPMMVGVAVVVSAVLVRARDRAPLRWLFAAPGRRRAGVARAV